MSDLQQLAEINEVKIETLKGSAAITGCAASMMTLNHWVMLATIIYIIIQTTILLHKHYYFVKDRKAKKKAKDEL